jgi:hypothetical protein
MCYKGSFLSLFFASSVLYAVEECDTLFQELALIEKIDREESDILPFTYNYAMMGGYFNMPSSRMPQESGIAAFGYARAHPYDIYGLSFQYFDRIEVSANYRIFTGMTEPRTGLLI